MVTMYDMTSGTLRMELEVISKPEGQIPPAMNEQAIYDSEPLLQEIEFICTEAVDCMPAHLAGVEIEDFIKTMK